MLRRFHRFILSLTQWQHHGASFLDAFVLSWRGQPAIAGGATWITDLKNGSTLHGSKQSLVYQARTSTAQGTGVDLGEGTGQGFVIIPVGTITDGTHVISVEESDNDNTAGNEAADAYAATSPAVAQSLAGVTAGTVVVVNFWRSKRYVRAVTTVSGSPNTGGPYGALIGSMRRKV